MDKLQRSPKLRQSGYLKEQRILLNRFSRCWANANFDTASDLLVKLDMARPTFAWNPAVETLPDVRCREMHRIWRQQAGTDTLPQQAECTVEAFREVAGLEGCLMILDATGCKDVFKYRHYGNELANHSGTNWQGRTTADMARFTAYALLFGASYLAVKARGEPLYCETISSPIMVVTTWCRYILPYVDAEGSIVSFLCANIPVPGLPTWKPPSRSLADRPVSVNKTGSAQLSEPAEQSSQSAERIAALLGMERNIRALLASSPSALMILTVDSHQIYFLNKALADMLGHDEFELSGMDPRLLFADSGDYRRARLGAASEKSIQDKEILLRRKDGELVWTIMSSHLIIFDHNQTTAFWFWDNSRRKAEEEALREAERHQLATIEQLEAVQKQLWSMAYTDTLTGIPNRRHLDNLLEYEIRQINRSGATLALLLIDIDWFKQVNDLHGHVIGDAVLRHVARVMDARKRESDTLARFGGEEFVLLLTDTDSAGALAVAESIRQAVANEPADVDGLNIPITISIGAACTNGKIKLQAELFAAADQALYRAKDNGRNRVEQF